MSVSVICDWCQQPIDDDARMDIEFTPRPWLMSGDRSPGTVGHFHNTDECIGQVDDALDALLEARAGLEAIPTATADEMDTLRPAHAVGASSPARSVDVGQVEEAPHRATAASCGLVGALNETTLITLRFAQLTQAIDSLDRCRRRLEDERDARDAPDEVRLADLRSCLESMRADLDALETLFNGRVI
jgi:hypothetical protein